LDMSLAMPTPKQQPQRMPLGMPLVPVLQQATLSPGFSSLPSRGAEPTLAYGGPPRLVSPPHAYGVGQVQRGGSLAKSGSLVFSTPRGALPVSARLPVRTVLPRQGLPLARATSEVALQSSVGFQTVMPSMAQGQIPMTMARGVTEPASRAPEPQRNFGKFQKVQEHDGHQDLDGSLASTASDDVEKGGDVEKEQMTKIKLDEISVEKMLRSDTKEPRKRRLFLAFLVLILALAAAALLSDAQLRPSHSLLNFKIASLAEEPELSTNPAQSLMPAAVRFTMAAVMATGVFACIKEAW